jgi:N-acyl amino acid synthase of PEP-CTERM/exosortase system
MMSEAYSRSPGTPRTLEITPPQLAGGLSALPETVMRYWRIAPLRTVEELKLSYALRCRVYCEERNFLSMENYPDGIEQDKYDDYSLHFGSFDGEGELVGSARLVLRGPLGFPMFDHCTIDPEWQTKIDGIPSLVEISRLVVSRRYRRRVNDGYYGIQHPGDPNNYDRRREARVAAGAPASSAQSDRRDQFSVAVSLFKAMYQAAQRLRVTHALSAMELTLLRLLHRYHFPFEKIGPECDYFGPVTPFLLDGMLVEERLAADAPDLLHEFRQGLDADQNAALIS